MPHPEFDSELLALLRAGTVIPAMPLALNHQRKFDLRRQRALTRYYLDAGAGGIAVGVHSTQFAIRDPQFALLEPVLATVSEAVDNWLQTTGPRPFLKIAGICGATEQALTEAALASHHGYHAGLLSLAALREASVPELLEHCRRVAETIPIIGFYLQPAVGGRPLPYEFWREFVTIDNVLAVKMAPFNRYQTLDVVRALCDAGREDRVTLYTGNDDNIVPDLLTEYRIVTDSGLKAVRIRGGLLGHWCVWTRTAVKLLEQLHGMTESGRIPADALSLGIQITDCNAAFFDAANQFRGCLPGLHEVLRRQGLLEGTWCLDPEERLSPGQSAEIDRVYRAYPHLNDDDFIRARLADWLNS